MEPSATKLKWRMLLVTMLCYLFFYTGRHNFGWAVKGMVASLHIPYSTIGWISFCMLIGYAIGQFINGNLADRLSPKLMVVTGAYLSIATNIAISFSGSAISIMILWGLNGFFQSMAWAPGAKLINNWWGEHERGKAFGFYTMAAGFSSAVTYLISIVLLQQGIEWRMLFRLPVLLLLVSATIFLFVAKNKPDEDILNESSTSNDNHDWIGRYREAFGNKRFLLTSLSFGFESMARYGLIFWVPVHFLGKNWKDNPGNIWVTFLLPVGMAIGALCFGVLSDSLFKGNRLQAIVVGMLVSGMLSILIYFVPTHQVLLSGVLMLLTGFFVYGPQACYWPLSPDMLGSRLTGTGVGIMNMCGYLFAAIGEPFLGYVIDLTGNSNNIFVVTAIACGVSALVAMIVARMGPAVPGNKQLVNKGII
ncbi:MFS transporter [Pedobacter sp. MC2016-05]|uniref:MFS transporter n=1 Tax=Pedobacter sp. MC2016-05 TaxID=2994474 RepID=UPI0022475BB4|nr:MFS transporter [Pedobacter sp. MC2016-05]MCX2473775.1 MFS transporter [Pedobacter sp. MC2016-05]